MLGGFFPKREKKKIWPGFPLPALVEVYNSLGPPSEVSRGGTFIGQPDGGGVKDGEAGIVGKG